MSSGFSNVLLRVRARTHTDIHTHTYTFAQTHDLQSFRTNSRPWTVRVQETLPTCCQVTSITAAAVQRVPMIWSHEPAGCPSCCPGSCSPNARKTGCLFIYSVSAHVAQVTGNSLQLGLANRWIYDRCRVGVKCKICKLMVSYGGILRYKQSRT